MAYAYPRSNVGYMVFHVMHGKEGIVTENELDQKNKTDNTPLLKNPVFLTAVFGAIIAAFANAYVAFINNNTLVDVETHKENEEQLIEAKKAEFSRLLEVSKLDVNLAKTKLKAFCEIHLITDISICIDDAPKTDKPNSQIGSNPAPTTAPKYSEDFTATWDSPQENGGHSQQEECNIGISELQKDNRYKGKNISIASASEDSSKDFFGHVTYRYHCVYRINSP